MKSFNTHRPYTPNGQRIAYTEAFGGTVFVDTDRGCDGFIPHVQLTDDEVVTAYDLDEFDSYPDFEKESDYQEFTTVKIELERLAQTI